MATKTSIKINKKKDTGSNTNEVELFWNRKVYTKTMNDADLAELEAAIALNTALEGEDIDDAITAALV